MPRQPKESKLRQLINNMAEENEYRNMQQNRDRARSVTVGTCSGGVLEIHMRGDYHSSWMALTPTEALEMAEQLASACGVKIAMRPKDDFSAWRGWNADNMDSDNPWTQPKLEGQREVARLPFEPNNPENRERIEEFMEQKGENDAPHLIGISKTHSQYANEPRNPASVAPKFAEDKPTRDENKIHEWFEDSADEITDETIARVERDKKSRDEYHAQEKELLRKSFLDRDKKRAAKEKAEAKTK